MKYSGGGVRHDPSHDMAARGCASPRRFSRRVLPAGRGVRALGALAPRPPPSAGTPSRPGEVPDRACSSSAGAGSSGLQAITERALARGYAVTSVSRRGAPPTRARALRAVDWRVGDAADPAVARDILAEPGFVGCVHAVGTLLRATSTRSPPEAARNPRRGRRTTSSRASPRSTPRTPPRRRRSAAGLGARGRRRRSAALRLRQRRGGAMGVPRPRGLARGLPASRPRGGGEARRVQRPRRPAGGLAQAELGVHDGQTRGAASRWPRSPSRTRSGSRSWTSRSPWTFSPPPPCARLRFRRRAARSITGRWSAWRRNRRMARTRGDDKKPEAQLGRRVT